MAVDWDDLRYLLALSAAGSMAGAAKAARAREPDGLRLNEAGAIASEAARSIGIIANSEAFLVIPPDGKDVSRVKIVLEALAALFARERALIAGESPALIAGEPPAGAV